MLDLQLLDPKTLTLLDNPIWNALSTRQSEYALGNGLAKRFHPDIGPLSGLLRQSPEAYASLGRLLKPDEPAVLFLEEEPRQPEDWKLIMHKQLVQMICPQVTVDLDESALEPLTESDVPAMLELTALTEPGPFRSRTWELGGFLGIRHEGQLAAMAGQRLAPPGFTEVSAVCTHPDFRGRGYARLLVAAVAKQILKRGETPFLTSFEHNTGAIRVYESVGFTLRRNFHLAFLSKGPSQP